jgi:hypothetical protein
MLTIHLHYKKPAKDTKRKKRQPIDENLTPEEQEEERKRREEEDELYMYRLEYSPSPATVLKFLEGAVQMIVDSTNQVTDLESDLMKSL